MPATYDVIVIGLGAMGSSAVFHLASRGQRVLGLERHAIPHAHGSSHGFSRVIRLAYFEHPDYVPLLQRSYENWFDLEKQSNQKILYQTGGLYMGAPDAEAISGSLRAMKQFNIPHQELTRTETMRRYPVADREKGALKRLAAIMAGHPELLAYHQTDCRGCMVYILKRSDIADGARIDSVYTRGMAVCN